MITKLYYNSMPNLTFVVAFLAAALSTDGRGLSLPQAVVKSASLESHEGLTISVQAWADPAQYKERFPQKSPYSAGILAVHVAFRNDADEGVRIGVDRIRLSLRVDEDNRQQLEPLTPDEVADGVFKPGGKDPTATRKKLPFPTGAAKGRKDKHWTEVQREAEDAGLPTRIVAPHSTVQGLLYFDLQGQFELLSTAHLYVPDIAVMKQNRSLTYFDIDLSRSSTN